MSKMFKDATAFNQYLGSWSLNASVNMANMLNNSGLNCGNYAATLIGWNAQSVTGRTLGASGRTYASYATAARANLVGTKGWTITGDALSSNCGGAFITQWDVTGTSSLSFGTATGGNVTYIWQEVSPGSASGAGTFSGSSLSITGLPSGATTIDVIIFPTNFQRFAISNRGDKDRLTNVKQWGTAAWSSMANAFFGCRNLKITATDIPNLSSVTRAESMFEDCRKLETVPNMGSWNVSTITTLTSMFKDCYLFNQDISGWNTSNVVSFQNTFGQAKAFNQNLGSWDVSKASSHGISLAYSGMDCANYEATLNGWNNSGATTKTLNAAGLNYGGNATAARASLVSKGWTINGDNSSNVCNAFITTWDLSIAGSGATQLSFGFATSGAVSYSWKEVGGSKTGNGTFTGSTLSLTGLPTGKTIELTIAPANFQRIISSNGNVDKNRLTNVKQWGTTAWTSMENAFVGCENLNITATGIPNLTSVNKTDQMFQNCKKLATVPNINSWDVSNVEFMSSMFNGTKFNQNIGSWNTSKALNMRYMFRGSWFNQDISGWNTAKVGSMLLMFEYTPFNQNLGNWTLNASVDLTNMLKNCGMDCNNYSATLIGWSKQSVTGRTLGATGLKYGSYAAADRTTLTTATGSGGKGWTITDGGQGTCSAPSVPGLEDQPAMNEVIGKASIWPNPVADMLNIEINEIYQDEKLYLTVTDMKGSVLMSQTVTHGNSAISTAGWPNALYVVTLRSEHDIIMISKISKQ
jgi:surface protein